MDGSPSIVPNHNDWDIYLVLDDFGGKYGRAWRETAEADTERFALIRDLLDGLYVNPARIIAFNPAAGWSRDVSHEIARELRECCPGPGGVPGGLDDFVAHHTAEMPESRPSSAAKLAAA